MAYEMINFLIRKKKEKQDFMLIKFDMSKTYDRVELSYLKKIILIMGLDAKMVKLIMA